MHVPWILARDVAGRFEGSPTPDAIEKKVRMAYNVLDELVDLAAAHKVPVEMPFASTTVPVTIGPFTVLSPSREQYLDLLPQFDRTPEAITTALDAVDASLREGKRLLAKAFEAMTSWVGDARYLTVDKSSTLPTLIPRSCASKT